MQLFTIDKSWRIAFASVAAGKAEGMGRFWSGLRDKEHGNFVSLCFQFSKNAYGLRHKNARLCKALSLHISSQQSHFAFNNKSHKFHCHPSKPYQKVPPNPPKATKETSENHRKHQKPPKIIKQPPKKKIKKKKKKKHLTHPPSDHDVFLWPPTMLSQDFDSIVTTCRRCIALSDQGPTECFLVGFM